MLPQVRTLQSRLTLWFLVIFGGIQLALWLVVVTVLSGYVARRFDREMEDRARLVAEAIEVAKTEDPNATNAVLGEFLAPFVSPGTFFQLRTEDGQTVFRSEAVRGRGFALPVCSPADRHTPHLRTLTGPLPVEYPVRGNVRLLTMWVGVPGQEMYCLQMGSDLGPVEQLTTELEQLLVVFLFVSLVVAAMTAWLVTRRHLTPLGAIARRAREISVSQLGERVPVPDTEGEITDLVHVINEMLERLETEFNNQQRFIADASHELKTPLAVLLGEAHTLGQVENLPPETASFVNSVEEETRQLLRTVEGFLILSRALSGRRPQFAQTVPVEDAVLRAVERSRRATRMSGVRIVPTFDPLGDTGEPRVLGDADLLCAMVENLLRNATRHSPQDSRVEVHVSSRDDDVEICVRDRGPGLPPGEMIRIFDMYHQAAPGGSAGIGLSIVKTVAEMHGGRVTARNMEDGGSEFLIRLPRLCGKPAQTDTKTG